MGKLVVTNGCFDVLHIGHINLLLYCRYVAGEDGQVIVLVDDDSKIRKDKGNQRPIFKTQERIKTIMSLCIIPGIPAVNQCLQFYNDEHLDRLIKENSPDVLVKGSDWMGKKVVGEDHAKEVIFFERMQYSSTSIIDRIKKGPEWRTLSQK